MSTNAQSRLCVLGLGVALLITGIAASPKGAVAAAGSLAIDIKNFAYAPMALTVPVGASVTWKNGDGEPHTVVSEEGLFRSKAMDEDDSFTFKFDKPGTYKYLCSIHPNMRGTIVVR